MSVRLGFIITIFLAIAFIMQMVESEAAPSGDQPSPRIFKFIHFILILCMVSLLDTIYFLYHIEEGEVILPKWLRKIWGCSCLGKINLYNLNYSLISKLKNCYYILLRN